jgi:hypothetical protein
MPAGHRPQRRSPDTPTPSPQPSPSLTRSPGPLPFCELPGSLQTTAAGIAVVPGGPATAPDLSFIHLPIGFCVHHFAKVGNTRQLRFSPSGDLFAASPTRFTTSDGGNANFGRLPGRAAIVVLPDDDHDGTADVVQTYLGDKSETVGMLFHDGYLYYQDGTKIMRIPHVLGDRIANGASEEIADITAYASPLHWPKALDADDNGTIYVTNGADEETPVPCNLTTQPFKGGILKLDGAPADDRRARLSQSDLAALRAWAQSLLRHRADARQLDPKRRTREAVADPPAITGAFLLRDASPPDDLLARTARTSSRPRSIRSSSATRHSTSTTSSAAGPIRGATAPTSRCTAATAIGPARAWSASASMP